MTYEDIVLERYHIKVLFIFHTIPDQLKYSIIDLSIFIRGVIKGIHLVGKMLLHFSLYSLLYVMDEVSGCM